MLSIKKAVCVLQYREIGGMGYGSIPVLGLIVNPVLMCPALGSGEIYLA
jgi:hypothetical protein